MNYVDVAVEVPALHSHTSWIEPGFPENKRETRFDLSGAVTLGAWRVPHVDLVVFTGLDLSSRAVQSLRMATWELPVEGGWRWYAGSKEHFARPYWELTGGPHLLLLLVSYNPAYVDAGLGTATGFGVTLGHGPVRGVVGARARGTLGLDEIDGNVIRPEAVRTWWWTPISGSIGGYAGASF